MLDAEKQKQNETAILLFSAVGGGVGQDSTPGDPLLCKTKTEHHKRETLLKGIFNKVLSSVEIVQRVSPKCSLTTDK